MTIFAAFVIVPLGLLFLVPGLIINLIQLMLFIFVRPVSRSLYRRINTTVAELLWLELIWLVDWWAGIKINFYADAETLELLGKEHALVLCNHRGDIDWLIGWVMAQRSGCLGSTLTLMRNEAKYLPIIGWCMWFSEYIFLAKNWAKDENILKAALYNLKDFPTTFWLCLYVEGTRFTQQNLDAAKAYASLKGLPSPRNVLIPRTKDAQLENYFTNDVFSDLDVHHVGRPIKPLILQAISVVLNGEDHIFVCLSPGCCNFNNATSDPIHIKGLVNSYQKTSTRISSRQGLQVAFHF
ncbi:unnamed protein product [Eruca vesicaria subsp. sativa]|uniref:Phospholipid/glycerol acyltransferase domain-containing protein n=1 Tax=Eruca vesicaria subsp. sativa TaxID=29727 RepID=A0ABC8LQU8_ERUVS|nr:unnamed protein product [Eruca vesicaria subsp. sativa]